MVGICCGEKGSFKTEDVVFCCSSFNYEEGKYIAPDGASQGVFHPDSHTWQGDSGAQDTIKAIIEREHKSNDWKVKTMISGCAVRVDAISVFDRVKQVRCNSRLLTH